MLGTFLAALDQTIVATALPTIVGLTELAGLQLDPRSHARLLRLGLAFIRLVGQGGEMIVAMLNLTRVGHIVLTWGESLRWDDHRQRLYCVDCATQTLHWLDHGDPPLHSLSLPTMPAGVVLTNGERLVVCLDDGLYVVDPDAGTWELLAAYPKGMHGRANDANADGSGNLITGTLNVTRAPGASWWFSAVEGWRLLDDDIGNANGPVVIDVNGQPTLVFADTPARVVYAYPYNGEIGTIGERFVLLDSAFPSA